MTARLGLSRLGQMRLGATFIEGALALEPVWWPGGIGIVSISHDSWEDALITVEWCPTVSGVFIPINSGITFTSTGSKLIELPVGYLRVTKTSGTLISQPAVKIGLTHRVFGD
jgi:hypothetical protein